MKQRQEIKFSFKAKQFESILLEFVTNSGLFWIMYFFFVSITKGVSTYFISPAHLFIGVASVIQAIILARQTQRSLWFGNLIAPLLYTAVDIAFEGRDFFTEPYHLLYWGYAICMTIFYNTRALQPGLSAVCEGIARTMLLPGLYMLSEWDVVQQNSLYAFWFYDMAHAFILTSSIIFGLLLGIANLLTKRFENALHTLAAYLGEVSTWAFDPLLIEQSYKDPSVLGLQRTQRTILFMDIRGFTSWSEQHSPAEVVHMLNDYYLCAEDIISACGGFKIQLEGDEVMTRFKMPDEAVQAAQGLQRDIATLLEPYGLGAGIGVHTGDVVEGMVGSKHTRQYGIFGDAVNVAARLQSAAKKGEIVLSATTYSLLKTKVSTLCQDKIQVKGKSAPLPIYVLSLDQHSALVYK